MSAKTHSGRSDWLIPAMLIVLSIVPAIFGTARLVELAGGAEITPANRGSSQTRSPWLCIFWSSSHTASSAHFSLPRVSVVATAAGIARRGGCSHYSDWQLH